VRKLGLGIIFGDVIRTYPTGAIVARIDRALTAAIGADEVEALSAPDERRLIHTMFANQRVYAAS